jgi:kynureninase
VLAMAPLAAALALFDDAGTDRLRTKSVALTGYLERLLTAECGERIRLLTPSAPAARGAQLSLQIEPKNEYVPSLAERLRAAGIIADWREPNVLRLAPVPLYNSYEDVYAAVQALKKALHS